MGAVKRGILGSGIGKKGMDDKLMFTMWELVVILMVVIVLTMSVNGIANNTVYWKKYHSADLALLTDVMLSDNGDFTVAYEMKRLDDSSVKKLLLVKPIDLVTYFSGTGYYIYSESREKDRIPQSYIVGTDGDIASASQESNGEYIILRKEGNKFSISEDYSIVDNPCPSSNTRADLSSKHFDVLQGTGVDSSFSKYISEYLRTTGTGDHNELLIGVGKSSKTSQNIIYYDSADRYNSEKMACLLSRQILHINPDISIKLEAYNANSPEVLSSGNTKIIDDSFISSSSGYEYWIYASIDSSQISREMLAQGLDKSIKEYYG